MTYKELRKLIDSHELESHIEDIAGVSTDFHGTYVVIDCVAVAKYALNDPDAHSKAERLAKHINKAYWDRIKSLFELIDDGG